MIINERDQVVFRRRLANTAAIQQYEGIKWTNDWTDAQWLAHRLRRGILPGGTFYPAELSPVRDLLRKRRQLVRELTRHPGSRLSCRKIKALECGEVERLFPRRELSMAINASQ